MNVKGYGVGTLGNHPVNFVKVDTLGISMWLRRKPTIPSWLAILPLLMMGGGKLRMSNSLVTIYPVMYGWNPTIMSRKGEPLFRSGGGRNMKGNARTVGVLVMKPHQLWNCLMYSRTIGYPLWISCNILAGAPHLVSPLHPHP